MQAHVDFHVFALKLLQSAIRSESDHSVSAFQVEQQQQRFHKKPFNNGDKSVQRSPRLMSPFHNKRGCDDGFLRSTRGTMARTK